MSCSTGRTILLQSSCAVSPSGYLPDNYLLPPGALVSGAISLSHTEGIDPFVSCCSNLFPAEALASPPAKKIHCHISNPSFTPPPNHNPRPPILQAAQRNLEKLDIASWEGWWLPVIDQDTGKVWRRQRKIRQERVGSIKALLGAVTHHVHIGTKEVWCTVSQMAELCQLLSVSEAGNKNMTRMSRAVVNVEDNGLFECEAGFWDSVLKKYVPKKIRVTPLFWEMLGITKEQLEHAEKQQQGYQNRGLLVEGEQISPDEARRRGREQKRSFFVGQRSQEKTEKKEIKVNRRLLQMSASEQRQEVARLLTMGMTKEELQSLDLNGFKEVVDYYMAKLRYLASTSPPQPD